MIRITIEISDTPLEEGQFYGRIIARPDNIEPVSNHERHMRDMIMNTLQEMAKKFVQSEGITKSIIAKVPLRRRRKDGKRNVGDDRRNTKEMR
jgi:hypothetical protein